MGVEIKGMDEALQRLEKLGMIATLNDIAKKAVNEAAEANRAAYAAALSAAEASGKGTSPDPGSAGKNVKATPATVNAWGVFSVAYPDGYDNQGTSNAKKANMLEYGVPGHLNARPFRGQAASAASSTCTLTMGKVVELEIERIMR